MSAHLILNSADLRALADGLDAMSAARKANRVSPGQYEQGLTLHTDLDDIAFRVKWDGDGGQWVIDDRYGS